MFIECIEKNVIDMFLIFKHEQGFIVCIAQGAPAPRLSRAWIPVDSTAIQERAMRPAVYARPPNPLNLHDLLAASLLLGAGAETGGAGTEVVAESPAQLVPL